MSRHQFKIADIKSSYKYQHNQTPDNIFKTDTNFKSTYNVLYQGTDFTLLISTINYTYDNIQSQMTSTQQGKDNQT